jgi:hypothetical protein
MKFKVGDLVLFYHCNTPNHPRNNKVHEIVYVRSELEFPYVIKDINKEQDGFSCLESELKLYKQPKNHLPKWF